MEARNIIHAKIGMYVINVIRTGQIMKLRMENDQEFMTFKEAKKIAKLSKEETFVKEEEE